VLWSAAWLRERGVEQGRLDAEHLLAHTMGTGRLQLYLQHDRPLDPEELARFKPLLRRRARREPLQYILGRTSFRELDLLTDGRVLIPRPETEVLVEVVLEWARRRAGSGPGLSAADVGTGSGCIALSPEAMTVAAENLARVVREVPVELRQGDLLDALAGERFDVLVSNPPYVAGRERSELEPEVRDFEPALALFAGEDGLAVIAPLVAGAPEHLHPGGMLALEVGLGQAAAVAELVRATGAFREVVVRRDLTGRPRVVLGQGRV
jgi:release factor glutamine methyltransferase